MIAELPPPPTQVLTHLSASTIKNYLSCPLRFFYEKVLRLPRESNVNLLIGKAVHEGLSIYNWSIWKTGTADLQQLLVDYRKEFNRMHDEDPITWKTAEGKSKAEETGAAIIETYVTHDLTTNPDKPLGVEVMLRDVDLGFDYPFVGIIDLVRRGNVVTDYKSIGRTPSDLAMEAWSHELQLTCYDLLFEEATGEKVNGMELIYLVKTKKPKVIKQELPPATATQRQRFRKMTQAMIEGVENERYYPCPGMHCSWCNFRRECSKWK